MSRRRYMMLLLGLVLLLLLFIPLLMLPGSLSQDAEGREWNWVPHSDANEEPITRLLNVTVSINEDELLSLQQWSDRFVAQFPGTEVQFRNLSYINAYEQLKREAALGELPDIILLESSWVQEFAARGYLDPLDDLLTAESLADHPASLIQQVKWNGYMWGVPLQADPYVTVWSRPLLAAGGLAEPPATWEQLIALTDAMGQEEAAGVPISPWLAGDNNVEIWLAWIAGLMNEKEEIEDLSTLPDEWWAFISNAVTEQRFRLDDSFNLRHRASELAQGEILSSVMRWSDYREASRQEGAVQLVLSMHEEKLLTAGGSSYVVSDGADDKSLAHAWIAAASSLESQRAALESRGALPARSSLYKRESSTTPHVPVWLTVALGAPSVWSPGPLSRVELEEMRVLWHRWSDGEMADDEYRVILENKLLPAK